MTTLVIPDGMVKLMKALTFLKAMLWSDATLATARLPAPKTPVCVAGMLTLTVDPLTDEYSAAGYTA